MKLKKVFFIVPLILLLGGITSCARNLRNLNDGTFIGSGVGRNGNIEVEITVTNGKIVAAKVLNDKETPEIAEEAKNEILQKFLTDGTTSQLDTLSGATITTNGLLDALDAAVAAAQGLEASDVSYHDTECDIVIIGAGGAGLV
ncbi:MAG: FMN-binding protein, partial [Treponema sp.]|nr:FMN-binding protein [Treponema sp.]